MKQKNNVLRLAIAACFGVAAGQANAAVTLGTPLIVASEVNSAATITTTAGALGPLAFNLNSIPGFAPSAANPLYIKVALLNGATFGAQPAVVCVGTGVSGAAGGAGTAVSAAGVISIGGTIGSNSVTFRVSGDNAMQAVDAAATGIVLNASGCFVSASVVTISGVSTKSVSAQLEYINGVTNTTTAQVGTYITFQRGLNTVVSAPATSVLVDATSGSDNWALGSNLTVGTAYLGTVYYGVTGAGAAALNNTALAATVDASSGMSAAGGSLTVSGPAIAASLAMAGASGVYLSTLATCANTTVAASFQASGTNSVTFSGLTPTQLSAGVAICGVVPGNVVITTGQLTATVTGRAQPSTTIDTSSVSNNGNNIANVGSNGSTRNAYFVNTSTSTNKTSILRIINRSGQSGTLTATAYDEAGAVLGTANSSLGTVANNQMLSKTSAEIETALGIPAQAATAKYSVVISGALPNFEVLNFTRDVATGNLTLSNTSTTNTQ